MQLPPPDPNEDLAGTPPTLELSEPVMWFLEGAPDGEAEQLASVILRYRPGALLVFDTR
jgi:hypothetical protein